MSPPPDAGKGPAIDEESARELLRRERERIESALADLNRVEQGEVAQLADQAADAAEVGESIEEQSVDQAVERSLRGELEAVERAEGRLADGSYGLSVESGEPIPRERLESIPWAERTADEQVEYERHHGKPW